MVALAKWIQQDDAASNEGGFFASTRQRKADTVARNRVGDFFVETEAHAEKTEPQILELHLVVFVVECDPASGVHKYLYAHDNPVMNLDPSGNITLTELKLVAYNIALRSTFAVPALYAANRVAMRVNFHSISRAIRSVQNGIISVRTRMPPQLFTGKQFEQTMRPFMRLISNRYNETVRVLLDGKLKQIRPDWITFGNRIVDAKLGQSIRIPQLRAFAQWAANHGTSVNYITLSKPPPSVVSAAEAAAVEFGVTVRFIVLVPF